MQEMTPFAVNEGIRMAEDIRKIRSNKCTTNIDPSISPLRDVFGNAKKMLLSLLRLEDSVVCVFLFCFGKRGTKWGPQNSV